MIVTFEGLDCSGKKTLSKRFVQEFNWFERHEFPDYDENFKSTPKIKQYLTGDIKLNHRELSKLFASNRQEFFDKIRYFEDEKRDLVFDRYSLSNLIYNQDKSLVDMVTNTEIALFEFIYKFNPRADITFLLNVEFGEILERLSKKQNRDINENNIELLQKCDRYINKVIYKDQSILPYLTKRLVLVRVNSDDTADYTYKKISDYFNFYLDNIDKNEYNSKQITTIDYI